ncbi:MAG: hypothetical protein H7A23_21925 [Leptospiraceae bacterium]|nr:hypothetical protein [Leptospiraceae bacterium]
MFFCSLSVAEGSVIILFIISCNNLSPGKSDQTIYPVISTLINNRMLLLLKGTYASDNPIQFSDYSSGTGAIYQDSTGDGSDPSFDDLSDLPSAQNLPIYIDIGEVRISSKYREGFIGMDGISDYKKNEKFWDYIASERQVYCTNLYALSSTTCEKTGIGKMQDFFNGVGAEYPSNDPTDGFNKLLPAQYYYTGIYFRNFVTGWAKRSGAFLTTTFDNVDIIGKNILLRNNYIPGTQEAEKDNKTPLLFPLFYAIQPGQDDLKIRGGYDPYILEIRINIKENLMLHSFYNAGVQANETLIGFSDWKYDHTGQIDMGGNLLSRARIIFPETASKLSISGGTTSTTHYYAVFRSDEQDTTNQLPLAATSVQDGTSTIKYIHDGTYRLQCVGDTAKVDGYPDTVVREITFTVPSYPFRETINVELQCP